MAARNVNQFSLINWFLKEKKCLVKTHLTWEFSNALIAKKIPISAFLFLGKPFLFHPYRAKLCPQDQKSKNKIKMFTILVVCFGFAGFSFALIFRQNIGMITKDYVYQGPILKSRTTEGFLACSHFCLSFPECFSFNYDSSAVNRGLCELHSLQRHTIGRKQELGLAFKPGFVFVRTYKEVRFYTEIFPCWKQWHWSYINSLHTNSVQRYILQEKKPFLLFIFWIAYCVLNRTHNNHLNIYTIRLYHFVFRQVRSFNKDFFTFISSTFFKMSKA